LLSGREELFEEVATDKLVYIGELSQERGHSFLDVNMSEIFHLDELSVYYTIEVNQDSLKMRRRIRCGDGKYPCWR